MKLRVEDGHGVAGKKSRFGSITTIEHPILTLEMSDNVKLELINAITAIAKVDSSPKLEIVKYDVEKKEIELADLAEKK